MQTPFCTRYFFTAGWIRWLPVLFLLPAFLLSLLSNLGYWQGLSQVETTLRQPQTAEEELLTNLATAVTRLKGGLEKRFANGQTLHPLLVWAQETQRQAMQSVPAAPQPILQYLTELTQILGTSQPLSPEEMTKALALLTAIPNLIEDARTRNHAKSHDILTVWLQQERVLQEEVTKSLGGIAILTLAALLAIFNHWKLENTLRESQRSLAALLGNLPGMAYRCHNDEQWTMLFVSQGCEALTGYPPTELLGNKSLSYNDIIDTRDQSRVWQEVQQALAENRTFQLTYRIVTAQGGEKWVWEQGSLLTCAGGGEDYLEGFITDITATVTAQEGLKRAKIQAEATTRNRGEAVLHLSHKARTPLTSLQGCLTLMANTAMEGPLAHYHAMARSASDQLSYVVEDLLDLAVSEHHQSVVTRLFQPHTILKQVADFVAHEAHCQGLTVVLTMDPAMPTWLRGNVPSLRKLLLHLLQHLIYHGGTGQLLLAARPLPTVNDPYLVGLSLTVAGEVADLAQSDHPIWQDPSVPHLVKLLNATFVDAHLAQGARYECIVPFELPTSLPVTTPPLASPLLPALNLLLAEDDPLLQEVISEFLEQQGHQVSIAADGLEVLAQVEKGRFDLILLDLRMPQLNGYQTAQRLHLSGCGEIASLPIVALTADLSEASLRQCLAVGINAVVGKPIDMAVLTATMAAVLGHKCALPGPTPPIPTTIPTPTNLEPADLLEETFLRLQESLGKPKLLYVAHLMQTNAQELVSRLQQALTNGDAADGKAAAHRLAGVAGNLGMERVAGDAIILEAAFSNDDLPRAATLLPQLATGVSKATSLLLQKLADI